MKFNGNEGLTKVQKTKNKKFVSVKVDIEVSVPVPGHN